MPLIRTLCACAMMTIMFSNSIPAQKAAPEISSSGLPAGYWPPEKSQAIYASGVNRMLQNNRPRRDQPYNAMQLMQWNFFLENGLLSFDAQAKRLNIHYDKYHDVVGKLLAEVLEVQYEGNKMAAESFIERYAKWDENVHGAVAKNIRDQQRYRFRLFKYAALGE